MQQKIILNSAKYANAESKNITSRISLSIPKHELPESNFEETVNQYNVYLDEREKCTKFRLSVGVNLVASNVLCNRVTEIVKNEGGDAQDGNPDRTCECLNFHNKTIATAFGKTSHKWGSNMLMATDDTQITYDRDSQKNFTYLCGLDIFNCHVLRATNKLPHYCYGWDNHPQFNTIQDFMMDRNGFKAQSRLYKATNRLHLYKTDDILSFAETLDEKLCDKNGWLGFVNCSTMKSYGDDQTSSYGIERVLNNESVGKYIDLFPGRDRFSLLPHYNNFRNRYENNWEYCLLYPYSSTTEGISCINSELKTLQISHIDENSLDDDDLYKTVIYSVAQHGLQKNDMVNIYRSNNDNTKSELVEENVIVDEIIDEYTFSVYLADQICQHWISIYDEDEIKEIFNTELSSIEKNEYITTDNQIYHAFNEYINYDTDDDNNDYIGAQHLSFAKVVNGEQCKYYVRIFSRLPNLSWGTDDPSEAFAYSTDNKGILNVDKYATSTYSHASSLTKLGYSKNAYNDPIAQIVYTDDINLEGIKDNLGRPLTSIYISFMKTNYGHQLWYDNGDLSDKFIEYSHCFGKLNCGFKYSPYVLDSKYDVGNINVMNNIKKKYRGLNQTNSGLRPSEINGRDYSIHPLDEDEIAFEYQTYFYGDLCYYSPSECLEVSLQPICYRFNTQQRELSGTDYGRKGKFGPVKYNEIYTDDYSSKRFAVSVYTLDSQPTNCPEGYYYQAHYEVPLRTFSSHVTEFNLKSTKIAKLTCVDNVYMLQTIDDNYVTSSENVYIYNIATTESVLCNIINILSTNTFTFSADTKLETDNVSNYRIYNKPASAPSYATVSKNGILRWRNVCQNGFEEIAQTIEEYPFTNGCFYVNKNINLFLRRQDPFGKFGLADDLGLALLTGDASPIENPEYTSYTNGVTTDNDNSSYNEEDSSC